MKRTFTVVVDGNVSKDFARHLAHEALSAHGVNPARGVSVELKIKEGNKLVSQMSIEKDGTSAVRIIKD